MADYFIGSSPVQKLMLGSVQVWEKITVPVISRRWSINLGGQYTNPFTDGNITWNLYHPSFAQIEAANGLKLSNLKTENNVVTTLSIVNTTAFNGSSASIADYLSAAPIYPVIVVNSGITLEGESVLKLAGLDNNKLYNISVLSTSDDYDCGTIMTINGVTAQINALNNYPLDGTDRYSNTSLLTIKNISPNLNSEIDIIFNKTDTYYQTVINLLLIEENG